MKLLTVLCLGFWFGLAFALPAEDASKTSTLQVYNNRKREIITREKLDEYLASKDDNTGDIVELAKSAFGGMVAISKIDYTKSGGQIAYEIAEAVVPIIGAALALIPGVGVIVSGVFLGLWGLLSPLFAPKKDENPMEKMIKEMAEKMEKKMDDKLRNLVNLAIYGEIARNNYICNKYTYISQYFSEQFKTNTTLKKIDAVRLMVYLNDCDNFLKDTAEAFVLKEYADVLWVPGAITTSTRLGFLAELIKIGHLIGMKRNVTVMYFQELKRDTQRHFEFFAEGLEMVYTNRKIRHYKADIDFLKDVSAVEKASCKLQSQLYYFDRELYSYGMPTILNNTDMFANIKMADFYDQSENNTVKHLQIFFNVTKANFPLYLPENNTRYFQSFKYPYRSMELMNCLLGPTMLTIPSTYWFSFQPLPAKQYSYEFRVMYLQRDLYDHNEESVPLLTEYDKNSPQFNGYLEVHNKINKNVDIGSKTCLNIEFIFAYDHPKAKETKKLIDIPGWARWKTCPFNEDRDYPYCNTFVNGWRGRFRMYSAGTFNHRNEDLNSLISIQEPTQRFIHYSGDRYAVSPTGFLLGLEIILRPLI